MNIPAKPIHRIPVILLSGFLGSGKTTLLNRLLAHAPDSAVIINEFGSMPIDPQLLREHNILLSTLAGGCLCCQVIGSLTPLLKNLRMAWDAKPDKPFGRIFIETSGVANPEPVLDTLLRERWLAARYRLEGMVTTVSAVHGEQVLSRFPEAQAQVTWADTVVITQTDLAAAGQVNRVMAQLDRLAPATIRLQAVQGIIDPTEIMAFVKPERYRLKNALSIPEHRFHSFSVQLDQPLAWERLKPILENLLSRYPAQLLRIKGVVYTLDENGPLSVQGAIGTLFPPARMPARAGDDGCGRLVFITDGEIPDLPAVIRGLIPAS
ncbi:MAG: GTP-binding protein [Methylovulum sp.]|nr:GTP-binding protein [Methylovulum sp.]